MSAPVLRVDIQSPSLSLYESLATMNGLHFTPREIDMIACIMHGRSTKGMSALLSIQVRTTETHVYNLMRKAGCNTRQRIRDVMERNRKAPLLRQHYHSLVIKAEFEKRLQDIARRIRKKAPRCYLVSNVDGQDTSLLEMLEKHLCQAGIEILYKGTNMRKGAISTAENIVNKAADYVLFVLFDDHDMSLESGEATQGDRSKRKSDGIRGMPIHVIIKRSQPPQGQEEFSYYEGIFKLLHRMLPSLNMEAAVDDFKKAVTNVEIRAAFPVEMRGRGENFPTGVHLFERGLSIVYKHRAGLFLTILLGALAGGLGSWMFNAARERSYASIQSDLFVPPEPIFLERPVLIAQMKQKLKSQRDIPTLAVVGIGGSGKTTLARHYANLQKASVMWELNAETRRSLARSFEHLAYALAQSEEEKKTLTRLEEIKNPIEREEKIFHFVRERLKGYPRWLLIYDNMEDFKTIQRRVPNTSALWGQGNVIITTRDATMKDNVYIKDVVAIGELTPQEQLQFFVSVMNKGEDYPLTPIQREKAKEFLKEIPPFPLDTAMAAYYLKATAIPYTEYVERLRECKAEFDQLQGTILGRASEYDKTRYGIIKLSLDRLILVNKDFGDLLAFLSLLDASDIPRELLQHYKDGLIVDSFISSLRTLSLIEDESFPSFQPVASFSIHRSTQELSLIYLMRELKLGKNHHLLKSIAKTLESYIARVKAKEDILRMKLLVSHCEMFLSHEKVIPAALRHSLGAELGNVYLYLSDYTKARQTLEAVLASLDRQDPRHASKVAFVLASLSEVYASFNDYEKARDSALQSLAIYKHHYPDDHARIAWGLSNLGNIYSALGDSEKALHALEQSIALYKTHAPTDYIHCAWTLLFLGYAYEACGAYIKAKEAFEHSLSICKKHLPDNPVKAAWALANLGNMYQALGNSTKAKEFIEESLSICKAHLPEDHRGIAWALGYLGIAYRELGHYEKARQVFERSLAIFMKHPSQTRINVAWVMSHMGLLESDQGHYAAAKIVLTKSLQTVEENFGKDHLKTACVLKDLGLVYMLEGQFEQGEEALQKAVTILKQNNHPESFRALEYLADLHLKKSSLARDQGNLQQSKAFKDQAINTLKQALAIAKAHFSVDCPHITRIQNRLMELAKDNH